jgi:hypothetical protein
MSFALLVDMEQVGLVLDPAPKQGNAPFESKGDPVLAPLTPKTVTTVPLVLVPVVGVHVNEADERVEEAIA